MSGFVRLVINENMKLYKRKMLWIMLLILVGTLILSLVLTLKTNPRHSGDWKAQVHQEIQGDQKTLSQEKSHFSPVTDALTQEIKIDQYRLKHNVPPLDGNTALGFLQFTLGFSSLLTLFIIIIASSIVSQEYAWGTIKLLMMRPINRWKILLSKYVTVLFNTLVLFLVLVVLSFLLGLIVFGPGHLSLHYVYAHQSEIRDVSIFTHFIQYLGSKLIGVIMISSFAFMLSTLFKSNALAIALSIIIQYAGSVIMVLLGQLNPNYSKYVFFSNTDLYQYVEGTPAIKGLTFGFSITVLLIYFVVFMAVSTIVFQKRDIVS